MALAETPLEHVLQQSLVPDNEIIYAAHAELERRKATVAIIRELILVLQTSAIWEVCESFPSSFWRGKAYWCTSRAGAAFGRRDAPGARSGSLDQAGGC